MTKQEIEILKSEIGRLQTVIRLLYEDQETKELAESLSETNKYLHEFMIKEMLAKDETGNYIHCT